MRTSIFTSAFLLIVCLASCMRLADKVGQGASAKEASAATEGDQEADKSSASYSAFSPDRLADEKKETTIKVNMSYLEGTWGLFCKSQKMEDSSAGQGGKQITFRLEFARVVPNVKELREAFTPRQPNSPDSALWFYLFDDENVVVYKTPPNKVEGEVTGKRGDAIRVTIFSLQRTTLDKTKKIEARPGEKEKKSR